MIYTKIRKVFNIFNTGDYVRILHPDYPELNGLAKIVNNRTSTIKVIEFCDDKSSFFAHIDYIRLATKEEIKEMEK